MSLSISLNNLCQALESDVVSVNVMGVPEFPCIRRILENCGHGQCVFLVRSSEDFLEIEIVEKIVGVYKKTYWSL